MKSTLIASALVVWTANLAAQQTPLLLTLDEAVARGLAAGHRVAEMTARRDAAEAVVAEMRSVLLPQVSAQAGYLRSNHVETFGVLLPNNQLRVIYPDIPDEFRTRLDLQWPIYVGGRSGALERAARAEASASADDLATARADLRLEITRAYWALVTAIESVRVVDESVTRVGAQLRDVLNRLAAGLIPPNEVSSVEAQESRQRMLSVQARAVRDVAEADLGRLVGVEPGTPLQPTSAAVEPPAPDPSVASLVEEARRRRSERVALEQRAAAAAERQWAAEAGLKPTVAVSGHLDYARPNSMIFPREASWKSSWQTGVNVNWPLFDGGRTRADVAEAAALKRASDERLAEFDATLAVEVRQRWSEGVSSQAAIAAATDAVRSASEARRVVADRFAAGVATSTEVLDAQVALLQAELDRTQAIANARLAEARLARAVGR